MQLSFGKVENLVSEVDWSDVYMQICININKLYCIYGKCLNSIHTKNGGNICSKTPTT